MKNKSKEHRAFQEELEKIRSREMMDQEEKAGRHDIIYGKVDDLIKLFTLL